VSTALRSWRVVFRIPWFPAHLRDLGVHVDRRHPAPSEDSDNRVDSASRFGLPADQQAVTRLEFEDLPGPETELGIVTRPFSDTVLFIATK
jgi:hypothetical protein